MKKILLSLVIIMLGFSVFAQTSEKPWAVGLGLHWAGFNSVDKPIGEQFKGMKFDGGLVEASLSRYMSRFFNFQLSTGIASFDITNETNYAITDESYWYGDLDVQIKFLGSVIDEEAILTPYIYAGLGEEYLNEEFNTKCQIGLGLDVHAYKGLGVYARMDYVVPFDGMGYTYYHPHVGLKYRFACKNDKDKDGIVDKKDACPDVYGLETLQGCPDKDGDGIADKDDKCPSVKGLTAFQGCPDTDGDGITDAEDGCPTASGSKDLKGCPDKDKDGIADKDDACPDVAGLSKFNGCPDTDGDGIQDKDDACPTIAGLANLKGCPDSDNDGIADKDDKCPTVPGTVAALGCPEITQAEKEQIIKIAKAIYFDTGKNVIKKESQSKLNELIPILTKYPELKLKIEGHTDNVGDDNKNMKLSQDRVDAVKKYLVDKGITANRMKAVGYGETKPIGDNKTAAGKAQNRRVEINTEY